MIQIQQVAVGGVIKNSEGKFLIVKRSLQDEFMPGSWEFPGGGTEIGENPEVGLKREILEECGIEITVLYPLLTAPYWMKNSEQEVHRVEILYLAEILSPTASVILSDEHEEFRWSDLDEIARLETSSFMKTILQKLFVHPLMS